MRRRVKRSVLSAAALFLLGSTAAAQETGISLGSWTLYPTVGLSIGYDDNVALTADNEIDSFFYLISPALRLETGSGASTFSLEYGIDYAEYEETSRDDYFDHHLLGTWDYRPTARSALQFDGRYERGHDRRGEGLQEFEPGLIDDDVDEYDLFGLAGMYGFGADGARGRLELNAAYEEVDYVNNRTLTRAGDHERFGYGATFYLRVAAKTSLLAEVRHSEIDYDSANRDSDETAYGVGLRWQATGASEGRAVIGRVDRDFDDPLLDGYTGTYWEVGASWRPLERTQVDLATRRETDEALGASQLLVREETAVSWRHLWRPRFMTAIDVSFLDEDFRPGPRDDDLVAFGISADYQWRPWLILGAAYRHYDRDSTIPEFNYERNEFLLTLELSR